MACFVVAFFLKDLPMGPILQVVRCSGGSALAPQREMGGRRAEGQCEPRSGRGVAGLALHTKLAGTKSGTSWRMTRHRGAEVDLGDAAFSCDATAAVPRTDICTTDYIHTKDKFSSKLLFLVVTKPGWIHMNLLDPYVSPDTICIPRCCQRAI
eukprot:SAG22_NODE_3322_length_1780_cov_0.989887_2_plen_153_part_00